VKQFRISDIDTDELFGTVELIREAPGVYVDARNLFEQYRMGLFKTLSGSLPPFLLAGLFTDTPIGALSSWIDSKSSATYESLEDATAEFERICVGVGGDFSGEKLYWIKLDPCS
jgi:hypothetical protein